MLSPLIISFRTRSIAGNFILLLIIAISLLLNSCTENDNDTGDYSKQFKAIYDTLDEYKALKKAPLITTRYLDSSFKLMAHPFINDRFRYYSFHFVYEMKSAHNSKKALLYADSMLLMAKQSVTKHQYQLNYAEANFALGDAYFELSQYSNAYKCYYQGYYIGKSQANYKILAEYTYRMGMVTFKQGHYREAAGYFKISHNQSKSYKDSFRAFYQRQELLANIGESYKNAGMLDSASIFLNNALDFINANNDRYNNLANMLEVARGVVYGNQGDIALLEHRYADAERLLKLSIEINLRKGNDNKDAQLTELKLANLYLDQNRQNDLSAVLKDLRAQLDSIPNYSAEMGFNYLASRYYSNQADNASALKYLKRYSSLKDSVTRLANTLKRTDVTTQQANYDKQNEINALKDNNKRQLIYIYIAVILSIMAIVIVFLVIRNLRKSKQDIQVIRSLNEKINQQKTHLENTLDELNSSSREKDRILRAVAHDLRNPLGGIASLSSAMIDDDYTPEQLDMINLIKDTSYNSLELINEILEAANTTTAGFSKEWVDANSLLSSSVELLRFKAADKKQTITLDLPEQHVQLFINREKIWRVISNLISNAIKFSYTGAEVHVAAKIRDNGVEFSIKDNGIGIPDELKQRVFNMFTDAKRNGTAGEKSFGLGLSICQQIVDKHNGKIWLESEPGFGTIFYVFLPFKVEEPVA